MEKNQPTKKPLPNRIVIEIAAETSTHPQTVRRAYYGKPGIGDSRRRVEEALRARGHLVGLLCALLLALGCAQGRADVLPAPDASPVALAAPYRGPAELPVGAGGQAGASTSEPGGTGGQAGTSISTWNGTGGQVGTGGTTASPGTGGAREDAGVPAGPEVGGVPILDSGATDILIAGCTGTLVPLYRWAHGPTAQPCCFDVQAPQRADGTTWIYVDKVLVPMDAAKGWYVNTDGSTISLVGSYCSDMIAAVTSQVDGVFGCAGFVAPNVMP